jgi:membrane protein YqaA with SNARE-associated domain
MKKTILILNDDRYFYPSALDRFLHQHGHRIEKIFVCPAFTDPVKKRTFEMTSAKIMGLPFLIRYLGRIALSFLLEVLPVSLQRKRLCSIDLVARFHQIPLQRIHSVNSPELATEIRDQKYETGLSMVSQIYAGEILSIPHFKLYNFHPSLLPRNKGKYPPFWAFYRKETVQGVTCHEITPKIDDGQIVFQKEFDMTGLRNVPDVLDHFVSKMPEYLEEALHRTDQANFQSPVNQYQSFYGPTPTAEQIREYKKIVGDHWLDQIKRNYDSPWYPFIMSLITAANIFVLFMPAEAILAGGILLKPKSWAKMAFLQTIAAIASTLLLTLLVYWKGQVVLDFLAPQLQNSDSWTRSTELMREWGLWALTLINILPFPILPAIAFAVFSKMSFLTIFYAILLGRVIKYYGLCFIASRPLS